MQYLYAFLIGGALCMIAQILLSKTNLTPARILVIYVVAGVFLSAVGLYRPLVEIGGAGALVPLSGFGHTLAEGAKKGVDSYGILGALTGGVSSAATGISAAIVFGFLMSLIFKPRTRK